MRRWIAAVGARLTGCGGGGADTRGPAPVGRYRPPLGVRWQLQPSGALDTRYAVQLYDLDLFDTPSQGSSPQANTWPPGLRPSITQLFEGMAGTPAQERCWRQGNRSCELTGDVRDGDSWQTYPKGAPSGSG